MDQKYANVIQIRKKIGSIFNKRREEFETLKEYNDYLEKKEDYITQLAENKNTLMIEAEIREYKRNNERSIHENRMREQNNLINNKEERNKTRNDKKISSLQVSSKQEYNKNTREQSTRLPMPLTNNYVLKNDGSISIVTPPSSSSSSNLNKISEQWSRAAKASAWSSDLYFDIIINQAFDNFIVS